MKRTERFARELLAPINTAAVVILGVYTFVWGAWVANPFWTVFTQAQLYGALERVAPEVFWGLLAMAVGVLIIYGAWKRSYRSLVCGAATGMWHWLMIAIFYFMGDVFSTGGITSLTFSVYAAFVYLNIRINYKDDPNSEKFKSDNGRL